MSDNNLRPGDDPTGASVRVPGSGDVVGPSSGANGGVSLIDGAEGPAFEKPKGRLASTVVLGVSQSIDNSEGGVSKTFFPQIMVAFGLSNAELGLLTSLGNAARMIFGPLWAMLADRFGRKAILFVVTGLWGLWTIGAAFAPSWEMLLVIYGVSLIGTVASEPILNGLLGSLYDKDERGKAFGTVRAVSSALGFILTPLLGQFGNNPDGWRWAFVSMGVLSVVSGVLILIFVKEPKKVTQEEVDDLKAEAGVFKLADAGKLLKIPTIALMIPMLFLVTSLILFAFMGQVWAADLGYGVVNSSYLFTVFQIGSTISALLGGMIGDFFVRRFGHKGRVMLFQLYCLMFAAIIALTMYFSSWFDSDVSPATKGVDPATGKAILEMTNQPSVTYYVMVFLMGLVFSIGFSGCVLPMISTVTPMQLSATAFAVLFSLVQGAINTVYPIIIGNVSVALGSLQLTILLLVSLPYALNALYWFVFYKVYPKDAALQAERTKLVAEGKF